MSDSIKTQATIDMIERYSTWSQTYSNMVEDAISRQTAIDAMSVVNDSICEQQAIDALCALPSAQPEPQWIPCERNLPEDYTDVLAWFEYFRYGDYNCLYQTYGIGSYSMEYDSWMINHETGWRKLRVIAWMPLPEPWRGEEHVPDE